MNLIDPSGLWSLSDLFSGWGRDKVANETAKSKVEDALKAAYCPAMKASFPYGACEAAYNSLKEICPHGTPAGELNDEYRLRCRGTVQAQDLLHCSDTNTTK